MTNGLFLVIGLNISSTSHNKNYNARRRRIVCDFNYKFDLITYRPRFDIVVRIDNDYSCSQAGLNSRVKLLLSAVLVYVRL